MDKIKRIQLLTDTEISDLYDRPCFNPDEREDFFFLNQSEEEVLNQYKNIRTKVYFILQLGYFKAKQQFFNVKFEDVPDDINFILKFYFQITENNWKGSISRDTFRNQKKDILHLFNYRRWSADLEIQVNDKLLELIRYFPKGHNALRQLLLYLDRERIIIPSYRKFQDLFSAAFLAEELRLKSLLLSIPMNYRSQLKKLIEQEEGLK